MANLEEVMRHLQARHDYHVVILVDAFICTPLAARSCLHSLHLGCGLRSNGGRVKKHQGPYAPGAREVPPSNLSGP